MQVDPYSGRKTVVGWLVVSISYYVIPVWIESYYILSPMYIPWGHENSCGWVACLYVIFNFWDFVCRRCRCWEPALFHARLRAPTWTHSRRDLMPSLLCLSVNTASDLSRLITATCLPIIRLHRCAQRMMRLLVVTSVSWSPCVSLCLLVTTVSSAKDVNRLRCHLGWDQGTQISPGEKAVLGELSCLLHS